MALEIQRRSSSAIWVTPFPQTFWLVSCASSAEAPILCSASFGITHRLCLQVWWIFLFEVMTTTFKEGCQSIHMERHYKTSEKHAQSSNCKHPNSLDQKKYFTSSDPHHDISKQPRVSGEGRHTTHLLKCVRLLSTSQTDWRQSSDMLPDISFDILSDIFSDIVSDILSGISPDILSGILSDISSV